MTPQEWLAEELTKPLYDGWTVDAIYAYLNAPRVTETPNPEDPEIVPVVLTVEEIIPIVTPAEWRAIRSPSTDWTEVSDAAIEAGEAANDQAIVEAAQNVDTALLRTYGPGVITLLQAVDGILRAGDPFLANDLIKTLVASGKLSQASAEALQAAMMQEDPDYQPVLYAVQPSIWKEATGLERFVMAEEIMEALDG